MAAMTTALTEFSNNGNSRTYIQTATHTALKPKLVIQKRKIPQGSQVLLEDTINVVHATTDAAGVVIPRRASIMITVRRPTDGTAADMTACLAIARDIVASDNFTSMVNTQAFLT